MSAKEIRKLLEGRKAMGKKSRTPPLLEDVLRTLRAHLPELRERHGVRTIGVFGSIMRGEQRRGSDVDLLVEFDERPLTLIQFIKFECYLSDLLGVKVDLVEKRALKPAIGQRILQEVLPV